MMPSDTFENIATEEFPRAVPERFRALIRNVAFLVEEAPSMELRREEGLADTETLLGHYRGIPATARGDSYGIGGTLPDTIILFQRPIERQARFLCKGDASQFEKNLRTVVRETIWHEVAHHFGFDEPEVQRKERERTS